MKYALVAIIAAILAPLPGHAAVNVFACEPEWSALASEIGGKHVTVYSATTGAQDPHYVQARPGLIAKMRQADLVICTGAGLEQGWLPLLFRQSANPKVQPGTVGYLEATSVVPLLDVPATIDRAMGDIHAGGNPHIQLSPDTFDPVGRTLVRHLSTIDPKNAEHYREGFRVFIERWREASRRWRAEISAVSGMPILTQHKTWSYLIAWAGLDEVATLEPKPGVPPGASHLQRILDNPRTAEAQAVLVASYQNPRPSAWIAERTNAEVVVLPATVGAGDGADDLFRLFDTIVGRLTAIGTSS